MKVIKVFAMMLCITTLGLAMSCSKEEEKQYNPAEQFYGRWETKSVTFDYSSEWDTNGNSGSTDVQIPNWKTKTDVPQYIVFNEDSSFVMKRKSSNVYGNWEYAEWDGGNIYKGSFYLNFRTPYVNNGYTFYSINARLLSHGENTIRLECFGISVDAGVFQEYEGVTEPKATIVMERL